MTVSDDTPLTDEANPKDVLGQKKSALRLVPPALAIEVAPVMQLGAKKYGPYNWREKPVRLAVYLEAMLRHVYAVMDGEWLDSESGRPHVAHIAASAGIVLDAEAIGNLIYEEQNEGAAPELMAAQDLSAVPRPGEEMGRGDYIEVPEGQRPQDVGTFINTGPPTPEERLPLEVETNREYAQRRIREEARGPNAEGIRRLLEDQMDNWLYGPEGDKPHAIRWARDPEGVERGEL
jgi:hypothetical protein